MRGYVDLGKRLCDAMKEKGITDPNAQEGIDFCVNSCPHEYCIVMEKPGKTKQNKSAERANIARRLRKYGVSVEDISLMLRVHKDTIYRYLRK